MQTKITLQQKRETNQDRRLSDCKCSSHLCVFVITVGGQKHFGYFIHATEEKRKLRLRSKNNTNAATTQEINETNSILHRSYKVKVLRMYMQMLLCWFTYILHHILLQVFNRLLFQRSLCKDIKQWTEDWE